MSTALPKGWPSGRRRGFTRSSAAEEGRLRTALGAARPGGAILGLSTGTGLGTAETWPSLAPGQARSRTWTRRSPDALGRCPAGIPSVGITAAVSW
ncbi:MAG TPA: hypothetical protein VN969_15955 [Streptosporangiaceae bacterium]|nr:hypothetical protein [Streptosporangiaceae bacterium]